MSNAAPITATTTLLGAAKLIRERGWCRGQFQDARGAMCLRGAIARHLAEALPWKSHDDVELISVMNRVSEEARLAVVSVLGYWGNPYSEPVANWNDSRCTSAEQAASLLERAAGVSPPLDGR